MRMDLQRGIWQPSQRQWHGVPFDVDLSHPLARGLVGYWLPMASAGSKLLDLSGNNNHAVLPNTTSRPTWIRSRVGPALSFDGNDIANIGSTGLLGANYSFSIFSRIRVNGDHFGFIFVGSTGNVFNVGLFSYTVPTLSLGLYVSNAYKTSSAGALVIGQWRTVGVTFQENGSGENVIFYVDGENFSNNTWATSLANTLDNTAIGVDSRDLSGQHLSGDIGDILLYNRALSASEVRQLYDNPYALLRPKSSLQLGKAPAATPEEPSTGARIFVVGGIPGVQFSGSNIRYVG